MRTYDPGTAVIVEGRRATVIDSWRTAQGEEVLVEFAYGDKAAVAFRVDDVQPVKRPYPKG